MMFTVNKVVELLALHSVKQLKDVILLKTMTTTANESMVM